jgi:hypothetical protein
MKHQQNPGKASGNTLTAANAIIQSSHHSLLVTMLLEINLKIMTGKVTAAMMVTSRMISSLRDGRGTPSQMSFWVMMSVATGEIKSARGSLLINWVQTGLLCEVA